MSAARAIQYRRHMSTDYSSSASQSILKQEPNFNPSQFHILIIQDTNTSPIINLKLIIQQMKIGPLNS